jgi:hypothetical protein
MVLFIVGNNQRLKLCIEGRKNRLLKKELLQNCKDEVKIMKYKLSCYNGSRIFRFDLIFIKLDEAIVEVEANNEAEAIAEARKRVVRDFYKVIRTEG